MTAGVIIESEPAGGGRVVLKARHGDDVLALDTIDPRSDVSRERFLKRIAEAVPALGDEGLATLRAQLVRAAAALPPPGQGQPELQGQPFAFESIEPWPSEVDGAALLDEVEARLTRHVRLPDHGAAAIALWAAHSYAMPAWDTSPRLILSSPEKRCGKSTALAVLDALVWRPLSASNVTAAALFRLIEAHGPTLLCDEADAWARANEELRALLNAGHSPLLTVPRCCGEDQEVRAFKVYAATALAAIGAMPGTVEDRAIIIRMQRRAHGEKVERVRLRTLRADLLDVRRRLVRWCSDRLADFRAAQPDEIEGLDDRAADNWRGLLGIATVAGGDWPAKTLVAAQALSASREQDEDSVRVALLRDVAAVFTDRSAAFLPSKEILSELLRLPGGRWQDYARGRPLTEKRLATLLGAFGVKPGQKWHLGENQRGYLFEKLTEPLSRYAGGPQTARPLEPSNGAASGLAHRETAPEPENRSASREPNNGAASSGLALRNPQEGGAAPPTTHYEDGEDEGERAAIADEGNERPMPPEPPRPRVATNVSAPRWRPPCRCCGSTRRWRLAGGGPWVCGTCRPAQPGLKIEWQAEEAVI